MTDKNNEQLIAKLISDSKSGKVSLRRFMEGTVAAGVTVAGASSMWSSKVQAATPKRGGTMRVGMHDGNTSDSLDPGTTESVYMIQLNHASRSYLTEITETNGLGPDMADSWSASTDAKVWRFELAKGVTFHNGKTFTSADAVASLNYHRGETKSAAKALLTDVESIKTDGDNAIIITMKSGNADLPFLLGDYHLPMLPAKGDGIDWESGTGAGPYKIVSHNAGVSTELVRHDGYHRDGLAHFDGVNLTVLNDPNSRQSALITGEVDVISDVDLKTVGLLGRAPAATAGGKTARHPTNGNRGATRRAAAPTAPPPASPRRRASGSPSDAASAATPATAATRAAPTPPPRTAAPARTPARRSPRSTTPCTAL